MSRFDEEDVGKIFCKVPRGTRIVLELLQDDDILATVAFPDGGGEIAASAASVEGAVKALNRNYEKEFKAAFARINDVKEDKDEEERFVRRETITKYVQKKRSTRRSGRVVRASEIGSRDRYAPARGAGCICLGGAERARIQRLVLGGIRQNGPEYRHLNGRNCSQGDGTCSNAIAGSAGCKVKRKTQRILRRVSM